MNGAHCVVPHATGPAPPAPPAPVPPTPPAIALPVMVINGSAPLAQAAMLTNNIEPSTRANHPRALIEQISTFIVIA
jgi:hypothetical protein